MTGFIAVRTAAPYLGGNPNLARHLVSQIGDTAHGSYVEPFVGMGGLFLKRHRRHPPKYSPISNAQRASCTSSTCRSAAMSQVGT
jgi:site-specific DNA-adenine methylase